MDGILRAAILSAADAVEASREALCALDASAGDGDHGVTMTIGARAVRRGLAAVADDDPRALVSAAATGMAGAGGAIGPLYGHALAAIAEAIDNPPGEAPVTVAQLRCCADAAVAAVQVLGRARPGDKTILDVLAPVASALAAADQASYPVKRAIEEARDAARTGALATAAMVAMVGRAARFGERSRGTVDPGASSCATIIEALATSALAEPSGPPAERP